MFIYGVSDKESWFFNSFGVYQKVNGRVYVYVSRMIGFYTVQLYQRSTADICTLEARSKNVETLFNLGESWLRLYSDYDLGNIKKDIHYIGADKWKENSWV